MGVKHQQIQQMELDSHTSFRPISMERGWSVSSSVARIKREIMKKLEVTNAFRRGYSSNPKAARYFLILICLIALIGVQRVTALRATAAAKTAGVLAISPSVQSSSACIAESLSASDTTFKR